MMRNVKDDHEKIVLDADFELLKIQQNQHCNCGPEECEHSFRFRLEKEKQNRPRQDPDVPS